MAEEIPSIQTVRIHCGNCYVYTCKVFVTDRIKSQISDKIKLPFYCYILVLNFEINFYVYPKNQTNKVKKGLLHKFVS